MAILNKTEFPLVGVQFKMSIIKQAAQHDKVVFNDAGIQLFAARIISTDSAATLTRNTLTTTSAITAATQAIGYTGGTALARLSGNYYAQIDDELIFVGKDAGYTATLGTMESVVRGALGTTATTHTATSTVYLLNSYNLGDSQTSLISAVWAAYPPDPRSKRFVMA